MFEISLFVWVILFLIVINLFLALYLVLLYFDNKMKPVRFEEEKYFLDPSTVPHEKKLFPSLSDPYSVDLSVIVPAYNEEERLPVMLEECIAFLEERVRTNNKYKYEIIIVDDGSSDRTTDVALNYAKTLGVEKFRVLTLKKNRGKGGAVRLGMLSARGERLLFADADGATKFEDLKKLEDSMDILCRESDYCTVIGSRAHLEKDAIAKRSAFRNFLMFGFHSLVWIFGVRNIRDTQCGFKLFTRKAAYVLFKLLHVERWAFDVELLYIANQLSMLHSEVAVNWTEIEGTKLVPFWSWLQMGKDLLFMWLKYQTRIWTIPSKNKIM